MSWITLSRNMIICLAYMGKTNDLNPKISMTLGKKYINISLVCSRGKHAFLFTRSILVSDWPLLTRENQPMKEQCQIISWQLEKIKTYCVRAQLEKHWPDPCKVYFNLYKSAISNGIASLSADISVCLTKATRKRQLLFSPYSLRATRNTSQRKTTYLFQAEMKGNSQIEKA